MNDQREILKTQQSQFEEKVRGLKSYVKELTEMAAKHGTDEALIQEDLSKAKGDIEFYEGQMAQCADAALDHPIARAVFHVYKDNAGEWRWRLVAGNDQFIADLGRGLSRQAGLHPRHRVGQRLEGGDARGRATTAATGGRQNFNGRKRRATPPAISVHETFPPVPTR